MVKQNSNGYLRKAGVKITVFFSLCLLFCGRTSESTIVHKLAINKIGIVDGGYD